jgi:surfactin synthase thioesterase subunit
MKDLSSQILEEEDTDDDILLLGHSMGGIMACGLAPQFKKGRIRGVVTVFTPHTLGRVIPALDYYRIIYGDLPSVSAPIISFGGMLDPLVWWCFTRHPRSVKHVYVASDHRFLLGWRRSIGRRIAQEAADMFTF